jgi:hypothetical protein
MQGIYTYIPEKNLVPKEYTVTAILSFMFLLLLLFTKIELSLGGSSHYTRTDKINKNIYTRVHKYSTKHSTNNTKHNQYQYTHYQNNQTLQTNLKQPQYKTHTK